MSVCEVPSCGGDIHAGGLCLKHYARVRRHGSVTGGRNGDGRVKSSHPLWEGWKSLLRNARKNGGYDPRWDDFWVFLSDVEADRPVSGGRLYRVDRSKPFGLGNVTWKKPILDAPQLQNKALYQRAWRAKRPRLARGNNLKKHYGISLEEYDQMHAAQGGVCAICGNPEVNRHGQSGEIMMLAVDHAHDKTQRIRALLCTGCNTGLGCFADDIPRLRAAIAYLESHAVPAIVAA